MSDYPYSPELPWGSWMRTSASSLGNVTIVDEHGRHFPSVREAFWTGRLRMSRVNPRVMNEQLELMLASFASRHRGIVAIDEAAHSLFAGDHLYQRFWAYWMHAEGLLDGGFRDDPLDGKLASEGIAVLRMLAATRPIELNAVPVGRAAVKFFGAPDSPDECDRARFEAAEASARMLRFAVVRERAFGCDAISILHRDPSDIIPVARTIWHMAWPDAALRDLAYRWMANRVDRWTSWGEMVIHDGAEALTQHLMVCLFVDRTDQRTSAPPEGTEDQLALPDSATRTKR